MNESTYGTLEFLDRAMILTGFHKGYIGIVKDERAVDTLHINRDDYNKEYLIDILGYCKWFPEYKVKKIVNVVNHE